MNNGKLQPRFSTCFSLVSEKAYLLYHTTENKMATWIPTGLRAAKLFFFFFFDGSESKYELWEVMFLEYLRIQHLHQIILSPTDQSDDMDIVEKNATVFAELIQYLDDKSLSLVIRDARDDGRKALTILKEHYFSKGKLKVNSLYTDLTSLTRLESVYYRLYNMDRKYFLCSERSWRSYKWQTFNCHGSKRITSEF